jgi:enoyl-CoA hydratase/carnithine racemase
VIGNDSLARELAYTARKMMADEAKEVGLVRLVMLVGWDFSLPKKHFNRIENLEKKMFSVGH